MRQLDPGAGAPGGYEIVSGHRRRAALRRLADEGKSKYLSVPCIVERDECSDAMRELRLIYANADTRRMTDAELSRQIERVHALLLQLRDEGVELPGRLRDHVAEAMHISRTKVGTLQATRKRLIPELAEAWDKGEINTAKAARLAKENADVQGHLVDTAFETVRDGTEAEIDRLCRERSEETREPERYDEPRPQWRIGTPPWAGLYYAEFQGGYKPHRVLARYEWGIWRFSHGAEIEADCVRWYPLPED